MPTGENEREGSAPNSDHFQIYLGILKQDVRPYSEQAERDAYGRMQLQIDGEEDPETRQFMKDTLQYWCQDGSMLISYAYKTHWHQWISEQRALQKEVQPIELYIALESILANTSDSTGYTKASWQSRYPLTIPGNYSGEKGVRNIDTKVPRVRFLKSYYRFGVHIFSVGRAIKSILDHLEERYGLDFKELERIHQDAEKRSSNSE